MRRGIIAANGQDYLLAIRYFQDARKAAGDAPEVLYNLGLAESKIPGRELLAICWFAAYLAAAPGAPNAAAVQQQIDVFDVKSQSTISRLIKSVQDAASKLPDAESRSQALSRVVKLWLLAGDSPQAITTSASLDTVWKQKTATDLRQQSPLTPYADTTFGVTDWANRLGDDPIFLDFPGYLKSQSSNAPQQLFDRIYSAAERMAGTQHAIDQQLKPQTERAAAAERDQREVDRVRTEIESMGGAAQPTAAQGYLGVEIRDLSEQQTGGLLLKDAHGAEIVQVAHDGPADKAGLRAHDIILQMDGTIVGGADHLTQMLHATTPGHAVSLLILRDGQQQTVTAQIADR